MCLAGLSFDSLLIPRTGYSLLNLPQYTVPRISLLPVVMTADTFLLISLLRLYPGVWCCPFFCLVPSLCLSVIGARRPGRRISKARGGEGRGFTRVFVLGIMLCNCVCLAGISLEILLNPSTGCSLLNLLQNNLARISFIRL